MARLYIVATPIGNLDDISLRALNVLKQVNCIAAEDTRHSQRLLSHFGIHKPLLSLHEFNEDKRTEAIIHRLKQGECVALISDAGTPLMSDPGYPVVAAAHEAGIPVTPIPGACAAIAALSAAGLATHHFVFEGFLPSKGEKRQKRLQALVHETRTLIFYEAVHRIVDLLERLVQVFGPDRLGCVARELTKKYECVTRATLSVLLEQIKGDAMQQKGEFVVIVSPGAEKEETAEACQRLLKILLAELPVNQSVKLAQKITGAKRQDLYDWALQLKALR